MKDILFEVTLKKKDNGTISQKLFPSENLIFFSPDESHLKGILNSIVEIKRESFYSFKLLGVSPSLLNYAEKIQLFREIGFISFSQMKLINNLTLFENLAYPPEFILGEKIKANEKIIIEYAQKYGLINDLGKLPSSLCENTYRLSLILRALIIMPRLIILNELIENLSERELSLITNSIAQNKISFVGISKKDFIAGLDAKMVAI